MCRLKEVRYRTGKQMSQFILGQETGIAASKISLIENGLVEATEVEKKRLADALGVTVAEIFGVEKAPSAPDSDKEVKATGKRKAENKETISDGK